MWRIQAKPTHTTWYLQGLPGNTGLITWKHTHVLKHMCVRQERKQERPLVWEVNTIWTFYPQNTQIHELHLFHFITRTNTHTQTLRGDVSCPLTPWVARHTLNHHTHKRRVKQLPEWCHVSSVQVTCVYTEYRKVSVSLPVSPTWDMLWHPLDWTGV